MPSKGDFKLELMEMEGVLGIIEEIENIPGVIIK